MTPMITKGDRVHVEFFLGDDMTRHSLAGFVMKLSGKMVNLIGICVHFRGNHPTNPTDTRIYIDVGGPLPDGLTLVKPYGCTHGHGHLEVQEGWIKAFEKDGKTWSINHD